MASGSLGTQQFLASGFFDPVDHPVSLVKVAKGFSEREAGLDHHPHPHREIGAHPPVEGEREDAAADELKRKLVICRGCMPPKPDDETGSIAVGGYIPARQSYWRGPKSADSRNRLSRDFRGRSIFDFCNSICQEETSSLIRSPRRREIAVSVAQRDRALLP